MPSADCAVPPVTLVEAVHVRVPFRRPLLDATGEFTHRRLWLLRIVDEQGREGLGEAALSPTADDITTGALAALLRELVPALVTGQAPSWSVLAAEGEPGRAAMAAVEGALGALDAGQGTAGGNVAPIPVSATISFGGPDAGADAAAQAVELGFETLKLRAGFERTTDHLVDRLRAIRAAVGPEPRVRIDAGGAWDLDTAAERMAAMEPFLIEYVEQPLAAWDMTGHAALRDRVRVSVALDESIDSESSARAALAEGAADVIVIKPARVGGSAATMRIVEAAAAAGATAVLGTFFESGVGIAAALRIAASMRATGRAPNPQTSPPRRHSIPALEPAHGLATAGILGHDLLRVPLPIEKGRMAVHAAVDLDESEVDRYALERIEARR